MTSTATDARSARCTNARSIIEKLEQRKLLSTVPNDPGYAQQAGLTAIDASTAWDAGTGSATVLVGAIDTGIDYTHADLYKNIWINQAEIPQAVRKSLTDADSDGIITFYDLNAAANAGKVADVNANGYIDGEDLLSPFRKDGSGGWENGRNGKSNRNDRYIDDIIGWDFADNDNNPMDTDGHGTHTAGIIGAEGNNGVGISGVVWKTSLMALKVFPNGGDGATDAAIAAAIRYAVDNDARVTNNSYGGSGGVTNQLYQAMAYADSNNVLMVFAAGNDGVNNDTSRNASYPATYEFESIISVGATDSTGTLAYFSNYGQTSVDLAAPGNEIYSTWINGEYATESGTSMAAPFVTGAIALMLSQNPSLTAAQIKSQLTAGADQASTMVGKTVSGGELNVANAAANTPGTQATAPVVPVVRPIIVMPWYGGYGYGDYYGQPFSSAWSILASTDGAGWVIA